MKMALLHSAYLPLITGMVQLFGNLDSLQGWHNRYGDIFGILEWTFTILFTIEYFLRLISIKKPLLYVMSFLGIIDLLAITPSYLSVFMPAHNRCLY